MLSKKRVAINVTIYMVIILAITILSSIWFNAMPFSSSLATFAQKCVPYILFIVITLFFNMVLEKKSWKELGFSKKYFIKQIIIGVPIGIVTVLIALLLPLLFGVPLNLLIGAPTQDLFFQIIRVFFFVGFGEEIVFRGYLQNRFSILCNSKWVALIITSLLFGFWHFINNQDFLQILITAIIGFIYGFCRIKKATTTSVSVAHGLHDSILAILSYILK